MNIEHPVVVDLNDVTFWDHVADTIDMIITLEGQSERHDATEARTVQNTAQQDSARFRAIHSNRIRESCCWHCVRFGFAMGAISALGNPLVEQGVREIWTKGKTSRKRKVD